MYTEIICQLNSLKYEYKIFARKYLMTAHAKSDLKCQQTFALLKRYYIDHK